MKKIDEINDPNSCLNKAAFDEILFVLRSKDPAMAATIRFWAEERIRLGLNKELDAKIISAKIDAADVEIIHLKKLIAELEQQENKS